MPTILRQSLTIVILLAAALMPAGAQTLQWARQFANPPNATFQIAADSTGVYVTGVTRKALPGQTAVNIQQDGFLRKYDPTGKELWTKEFAFNNRPFTSNSVAVDSTGVYVAGVQGTLVGPARRRAPNGSVDILAKYDLNGNLLWTKQSPPSGSARGESAAAVAANSGYVYVVGSFLGIVNNALTEGMYVRKLDQAGNVAWTSQFGSINGNAWSVAADASGAYVFGTTQTSLTTPPSPVSQDLFVRKYDTSGNAAWTRQFGTTNSEYPYAITVNSTGVFAVGSTQGLIGIQTLPTFDFDAYIKKYDLNGNLQWTQQFGTIDREEALGAQADDTGLYIVGYTRSTLPGLKSLGGEDAFIRRYDNNGNPLWTIQTGSVNDDYAYGVASDGSSIYVGGYTDSNSIPDTLTNKADSFLYKYTPPAPSGPFVLEGGIVNNASFATSPAPVAPGSIAAIFGTGLNDGSQVLSSSYGADGKLVTTLGGASVTVGGIPAPIFYSTSGQLGIQIPMEVAGQASAQVQVTVRGQASVPRSVNITSTKPGLFTLTQDGRGTAIAVHSDGITLVTTDNPAHPNEVVIFYGTGFGPVTPSLGTGQPSIGNQTVSLPKVTIDGIDAQVLFGGLAGGLVGLDQLNVIVPGLARQNPADPVVVTINNVPSNTVTLPVAP